MGGLTPDKKLYLASFSHYLHIYVPNYDFMHILNISTSADPRTFSWTYFEAKWSIYGGYYSGQKVVSLMVTAFFAYGYELHICYIIYVFRFKLYSAVKDGQHMVRIAPVVSFAPVYPSSLTDRNLRH
eukprot:sb/3475470/